MTALSTFDRGVYHAIACYAPSEAIAWPGQQTIADDLGCSRYAVNRAVQRLRRAGWLEVVARPPGRRGWTYCVYALLAPFAVSRWAIERIVRRARRRRLRGLHTNPKGQGLRDSTSGTPGGPPDASQAAAGALGAHRERWRRPPPRRLGPTGIEEDVRAHDRHDGGAR